MTNLATERQISELQVAYSYCLSHLAHLGDRSSLKLKKSFPTYESWVQLSPSEREEAAKRVLGSDSKSVVTLNFDSLIERAFVDFKKHQREGIQVFSIDSDEYPQLLKQIPDPPLVLFVKGSIEAVADGSNVAVVGTRDATLTGEKVASKIAKWLGEHRWCVVSGLAKGIDSAAHRGALDVRWRTVAVMATPLNKIYPAENKQLANDILDQGGCWISELPLWKKPHRGAFVQRDRIQSGMSVAVVPVQTDVEGGTMHTVRYAEQQHRLVLCPRPIESEQFVKQYAGIRNLIDTGRAVPFSSNEYEHILESLSNRRDELLNLPGHEPSNEPIAPFVTSGDKMPVEHTNSEPEPAVQDKPKPKRRSRLQVPFDFIEEPVVGKPKEKSGPLTSEEHERITSQIAKAIFEQVELAAPARVQYGRSNHETGASGFSHQIDVSIHGARDTVLVECKYWARRIPSQCILEFASRLNDIARATSDPTSVKGIIVSKKGVQAGSEMLANYFDIELGVVRSANEFVMKYKALISAGVADTLSHWRDDIKLSLGANPKE